MKKSTYILGMVCLSIILAGTLFKALHLPGAAILLTLGIISMTIVWMPITLIRLVKATNDPLLKLVYYAAYISFSFDFVGMLFKVMHWPGANLFIMIGVPLPFVLFLPAYMVYHNKQKLKADLHFFGIILFMIYLGVFSSMLAINVSHTVYDSYAQTAQQLNTTNLQIASHSAINPKSEQTVIAKSLVDDIQALKVRLIVVADAKNESLIRPDGTFEIEKIYAMDKKIPYEAFNDAGFASISTQLESFTKVYKGSDNTIDRLIEEIAIYKNPKLHNEAPLITYLPLIIALDVLTDWQNKVMLIPYISENSLKIES